MASLLAASDLAVLYLGSDRTIRRFTPAAARLFHLAAADVGRPLSDVRPRFAEPPLEADIQAVLQTRAPTTREVHADDRWYLQRVASYRTADRRIDGLVVTYTDVTALKRAEASLRETEASLRAERDLLDAVLETVPALLVVRDAAGRILRFNRFAEQISGIDSRQALGAFLWDEILGVDQAERVRDIFERTLAGEPQVWQDLEWRHRDGARRTIAWSAVRTDSPDGTRYVIATGLDVTDQRAAERDARSRLDELAALHRLHTANELAATLAHELNQPLAAISSLSEASGALLAAGEHGRLAENLQAIAAQSLRAGRYINELRRFVARQEITRRRVDLNAVVRSAAALAAPLAHRHAVRILLALAELPPVEAAELQIEHLVTNLLRNAIEAIAGAGLASGEVRIGTRATPEGMACVTVADSGPGVPAGELDRLFDPFFTTKPGGLGMGLRVSRTIVTAHGGRIWAEPGPDGMLAFTVPLAK